MTTIVTAMSIAVSSALAAWSLWFLIKNRPVILKQLLAAITAEVLLLVHVATVLYFQVSGGAEGDFVKLWGYLISVLLILPAAAVWAFADRTRWSSAVLLTAHLTLIVLLWRLVQIWQQEIVL